MGARDLAAVFQDTQHRFRRVPKLWIQMQCAKKRTQLYPEGYSSLQRKKKGELQIDVIENTSFRCAGEYVQRGIKVAVLNFANPCEPGGGVLRGAMAQEECLCRCSDLFETLNQPRFLRAYYQYHDQKGDYFFSDRIIYSPGITVIKSDDYIPQLLKRPFLVDVITCAAPYIDNRICRSDDEMLSIYESRIKNILEVAMSNDVDILILGAFGCGAFHNNPDIIANAFFDLLIQNQYAQYFQKVIFAIKRSGRFCKNLFAFEKTFYGFSNEESIK